jgi:hypothetical protein
MDKRGEGFNLTTRMNEGGLELPITQR